MTRCYQYSKYCTFWERWLHNLLTNVVIYYESMKVLFIHIFLFLKLEKNYVMLNHWNLSVTLFYIIIIVYSTLVIQTKLLLIITIIVLKKYIFKGLSNNDFEYNQYIRKQQKRRLLLTVGLIRQIKRCVKLKSHKNFYKRNAYLI